MLKKQGNVYKTATKLAKPQTHIFRNYMTANNAATDILLARLAEGLDSTAKMTQALLADLRDSETDFAAFKTELNILKDNVRSLSQLIREGDGTSSLLTRVAVIEHRLDNIEHFISDLEDQKRENARMSQISINREQDIEAEKKKTDEKIKAEKQSAIIKIIAAIALGIIGLVGGFATSKCSGSDSKPKPGIELKITSPPTSPS